MSERPRVLGCFPVAVNHRGEETGVWLGAAMVGALLLWFTLTTALDAAIGDGIAPWRRDLSWDLGGVIAVFGAGLYDDFRPTRERGLIRQLMLLGRGRVTSGVVKIVVIGAAAATVSWALGARGTRLALGALVIAGAANLWNLLDVAPGRSLKFFLPVAIVLAVALAGMAEEAAAAALVTASVGAAAVCLVPDVREWAMLGDAGANVLGFVIGIGLFEVLDDAWLSVALAGILALHAVSETVTLSKAIASAPPLRWFDRLGRLPDPHREPST